MPYLTSLPSIALLRAAVVAVVALALLLAIAGCGGSPASSGAPGPAADYEATVQVLLPTAPPPATATLAPTATEPPPAIVDTPPAPSASTPRPTYTPRPRPTYTPHPTPTPRSTTDEAGGREAAVPFSAYLLDGSQLALADSIGAPTLLAFWAPW